jgi:hypothetical protein
MLRFASIVALATLAAASSAVAQTAGGEVVGHFMGIDRVDFPRFARKLLGSLVTLNGRGWMKMRPSIAPFKSPNTCRMRPMAAQS